MTIDDLSSSLESHEQRKRKKKEVLEEALQTKMQHNRGRQGDVRAT